MGMLCASHSSQPENPMQNHRKPPSPVCGKLPARSLKPIGQPISNRPASTSKNHALAISRTRYKSNSRRAGSSRASFMAHQAENPRVRR